MCARGGGLPATAALLLAAAQLGWLYSLLPSRPQNTARATRPPTATCDAPLVVVVPLLGGRAAAEAAIDATLGRWRAVPPCSDNRAEPTLAGAVFAWPAGGEVPLAQLGRVLAERAVSLERCLGRVELLGLGEKRLSL